MPSIVEADSETRHRTARRMCVSLHRDQPTHLQGLTDSVVEIFGDLLLEEIQSSPRGDDPDATRRALALAVAAASAGSRDVVEELRSCFIRRLHRASDDFAASAGLRVTEAALGMIPRSVEIPDAPSRAPGGHRRWRRRR
jgi:hypothetical protein